MTKPPFLDVTGISSDVHDPHILRLHFLERVTSDDRRALLEAVNLLNSRAFRKAIEVAAPKETL